CGHSPLPGDTPLRARRARALRGSPEAVCRGVVEKSRARTFPFSGGTYVLYWRGRGCPPVEVRLAMEGRFSPVDLAELVRDLFLAERTGWLDLARPGGPTLSFEFRLGMLQYGEGDEEEDLGRRLVREGRLSSAALAEAMAVGAPPRDLGRILVEKEFV